MIKIKDLDLLKNIDILFENEIILYGAGDYGRKACKLLKGIKLSILGLCDSNVTKWEKEIEGCKVMSFSEMTDILKEKNQVILIFTMANPGNVKQVLEVLERYEISEIDCYTYFALKNTIELHIDNLDIEETFCSNGKTVEKLYRDYRVHRKEYLALSVLYNAVQNGKVLLVLQPKKVGSLSVYESLRREQISCYHLHKWEWVKTFEKTQKGFGLLQEVGEIRIISLVRDPIARGVSQYFQYMESHVKKRSFFVPDTYEGVTALLKEETEMGVYGYMFEWFNMEIKDTFGIDVYQYDFDREKGYQIIKQDNVELLLLKLEKLNDCEEIIGQFAGVKDFKLMKANMGNDKLYRFAYEELKKKIEIPQNILDFYYKDNLAMDHFYTLEEKETFYKKWLKKD